MTARAAVLFALVVHNDIDDAQSFALDLRSAF